MIIASSAILAWIWNPVFFHPNDYILSMSGDGIKNIYNYLEFIRTDGGWIRDHVGYPFGEHIAYLDAYLLVAFSVKGLMAIGIDLSPFALGIFNLTIIWSTLICNILLYLILRQYRLPRIYSAILAMLIGFMSPQIIRSLGHFSLSLSFFIPFIWYQLNFIYKDDRIRLRTVLITLFLFIMGWAHPYYMLVGAGFILTYTLVAWVRREMNIITVIGMVLSAVIPIAAFTLITGMTDDGGLRHPFPYGITEYHTSIESIFLPIFGPFHHFFTKLFSAKPFIWEGIGYPGIIPVLAFLSLFFWTIYRLIRKKKQGWNKILRWNIPSLLIAVVIIFFFASAVLFKLFPGMVDHLGPLRQFRSLGRFAWIIYYIIAVFGAITLYDLFMRLALKNEILAIGFAVLGMGIWGLESYHHLRSNIIVAKHQSIAPIDRFEDKTGEIAKVLAEADLKPKDFEAMLYFPYINMGSEEIYIHRGWTFPMYRVMNATGIPLATFHSSRSVIKEAQQLATLLSPEYISKPTGFELGSRILIVTFGDEFTSDERELIGKSKFIGCTDEVCLYSIHSMRFYRNLRLEAIEEFESRRDSLFNISSNVFTSSYRRDIIWNGFEDGEVKGLQGKGLKSKEEEVMLYEGPLPDAQDTTYIISVWFKSLPERASFPDLVYRQHMADGTIEEWMIHPSQLTTYSGSWVRAELPFDLQDRDNRIEVIYSGRETKVVDQLLIQPAGTDVWIESDEGLIYNNWNLGQ